MQANKDLILCLVKGLLVFVFGLALWGSGCGHEESGGGERPDLVIAVTPGLESLPLIAARDEDFFAKEGVSVELRMAKDYSEVEILLRSGAVDGGLGSFLSLPRLQGEGFFVMASSRAEQYYLLFVSPGFYNSLEEDKEVAVSFSGDLPELYLLEKLLAVVVEEQELEGAEPIYIRKECPQQALSGFKEGNAAGVFIPGRLKEEALAAGGEIAISSLEARLTSGAVLFLGEVLQKKKVQVELFYRGYHEAVKFLNSLESAALIKVLDQHVSNAELPAFSRQNPFREPRAFNRDEVNELLAWLKERTGIGGGNGFEAMVWEYSLNAGR